MFGIANFYAGIRFFLTVDEDKKFQYPEESIEKSEYPSRPKIDDTIFPEKSKRLYILGTILLFLGLILGAINVGIYRPFILPIIFEKMNEPATLISWFYLPATVVGTLIAPRLGVIADKINPYLTITITSIIGGIITWIIIFLVTNLWIFSILLIIDNTIMITSGFVFINFLSRISEKHRGKIFGLITTFDSLGYIIGPILGGFVYDINYTIPFIISILVEWALIPFFVLGIWILNPQIVERIEDKKN